MPSDTRLGPKTEFQRGLAREGWLSLPRQPAVRLAAGVGVVGMGIVTLATLLILASGEAFAEILVGLGCIGWSIGQLRVHVPAWDAWRRIGRVRLEADTIELSLGVPWPCRVVIEPRRALTLVQCTLTAWMTDSRRGQPGPTAWAFDVVPPATPLTPGVRYTLDALVELPLPPDGAPSYFAAEWSRKWTITAECTTHDGAQWRRDYPILVHPAPGALGTGATGWGGGADAEETAAPE